MNGEGVLPTYQNEVRKLSNVNNNVSTFNLLIFNAAAE